MKGTIWYWIPKTGGISLHNVLYVGAASCRKDEMGSAWLTTPNGGTIRFVQHRRPIDMNRLHGFSRWQQEHDWESFTVIRNPWRRIVSAYHASPANRDKFGTFAGFVHALIKRPEDTADSPNWPKHPPGAPQSWWVYWPGGDRAVKRVFRLEDIAKEWPAYFRDLGYDGPLPHLHTHKYSPWREHYTRRLRDIVDDYERRIVEEFGYSFEGD